MVEVKDEFFDPQLLRAFAGVERGSAQCALGVRGTCAHGGDELSYALLHPDALSDLCAKARARGFEREVVFELRVFFEIFDNEEEEEGGGDEYSCGLKDDTLIDLLH